LAILREHIKPGISTAELDTIAEREIRRRGATPSFKGYGAPIPFPAAICVAINEQVVHGIPSKLQLLREGDIIGIDVGALMNGWQGDSCVTFPVGTIAPEAARLLRVTEECLMLGIEEAQLGKTIGDIGHVIQTHAEGAGYGVVRGLGGHDRADDQSRGARLARAQRRLDDRHRRRQTLGAVRAHDRDHRAWTGDPEQALRLRRGLACEQRNARGAAQTCRPSRIHSHAQ